MQTLQTFGLIGFPLSHSFSKKYFEEKWTFQNINSLYTYKLFPLKEIKFLRQLIDNELNLSGLNVTIPYKVEVMEYLDYIDKEAQKVGAINTIKINKNDDRFFLSGYNTDIFGFEKALQNLLNTSEKTKKALILGTGGASKAVSYVLDKLSFEYICVSRHPQKYRNTISYHAIDKKILDEFKLIINTTPLGMYPDIDSFPDIPYNLLSNRHILMDLVYNPPITTFMKKGKEQGAKVENGYSIFCIQADKSWEIWNAPR